MIQSNLITGSSSADLESASMRPIEGVVTDGSTPQLEEIITEDGILCLILSFLNLKEAVRTSVLSSRWRHLWTHLTKFDFNAVTLLDAHTLRGRDLDGEEAYHLTNGKTAKYIRSVDSILRRIRVARLDEFVIRHFLDKRHCRRLDAWVRFAVALETKTFRLHLFKSYWSSPVEPYDFPCQLLRSSQSIEIFSLCFCSFKLPCKFDGLSKLKQFVIANVDMTEDDFNCILSNCSSTLVSLGVWEAPRWESISIPHSQSQLKILYIQNCNRLKKIHINAVNLRELHYRGLPVEFILRQSSKLNDACVCFKTEENVRNLGFYLNKLSSGLPHLQSLSLKITGVSKVGDLPEGSSIFNHLTSLVCEWDVRVEMSLLHLTTILDTSPCLKELKLSFLAHVEEPPPQTPSKFKEMLSKHPHTHLKKIEITGFSFSTLQIEIVAYLLNNTKKLELMTVAKCSRPLRPVSEEIHETSMKNLSLVVPANAKLVIL